MPKVRGELTVWYVVEVEAEGDPEEIAANAHDIIEDAYANGELGVLDGHQWDAVFVDDALVFGEVSS